MSYRKSVQWEGNTDFGLPRLRPACGLQNWVCGLKKKPPKKSKAVVSKFTFLHWCGPSCILFYLGPHKVWGKGFQPSALSSGQIPSFHTSFSPDLKERGFRFQFPFRNIAADYGRRRSACEAWDRNPRPAMLTWLGVLGKYQLWVKQEESLYVINRCL